MPRSHTSWILALAVLAFVGAPAAAQTTSHSDNETLDRFITRKADKLLDGKEEFRFISLNVPNLHYVEDNQRFDAPSAWRLPDEFEIVDALESIRQMGGTVVRLYTLAVRRDDDPTAPVHVLGPGRFNEETFRALDRVLMHANRLGVRVIIPLVDNWKWWGGRGEYAAFRGKPKDAFWTDPQLITDFQKTIDYVVHRQNTLTGLRYRDDPAILAWETGNELECPPEWTRQVAAHLKRVDPNHLVIDGRHTARLHQTSIDEPNVDLVTTHHYSTDPKTTLAEIAANRAMSKGKKPYFVGEFGFIDTPAIEAILDEIIRNGSSGALLWSLRPHNRDGGFHWHSEPFGHGKYKAYHWPGFPSGAAYDETAVLDLMRRKAFAIRGLSVPPRDRPRAPRLLPVADVAAITWQGSTGASAYDVERADAPEGPWSVVGRDVCDAAVPYRPLFHDASAQLGASYFYRVRAKNSAGTSAASNVVGPVEVTHRTLVDELADASLLHAQIGSPTFVWKDARRTKEDFHRLQARSGEAIVYHTEGPILGATVWAFFHDEVSDPTFFISTDGERFEEVVPRKKAYFGGAGEYDYAKPLRYRLSDLPPNGRFLKIAFATLTEVGRIEIRSGASAQ